jgi:F-box protein 18 (helicase)
LGNRNIPIRHAYFCRMQLTGEQYNILNSTGDIKINAVAGSGKTTTVIAYAKTRPANASILYLAFNKAVKNEAKKKFAEQGLHHVYVETAHSLAYKYVVAGSGYRVRKQDYKSYEIAELLGIEGTGEKHMEYVIANHVQKFVAFFCNSDKTRVQELNYLDVISEPKAKVFVQSFYQYILNATRRLLAKMDKGEIEITHDFYLKKFQLLDPRLQYDYILFDEGQDASPAMLDIFLKQPATKVIVGDTNQQIYSWRYAVNSLEQVNFQTFHLSTSFRFPQTIADLAKEVLRWKNHLGEQKAVDITGAGQPRQTKSKAVIARTNLGLLLKAIEYVTERKTIGKIYFEGNIYSYTYADEGASLYDVLNLFNGKRSMIKDKLMQSMSSMKDLNDYIDKTEDAQLAMMVEIVEEYGNEIPGIIKTLKDKHIGDEERENADIVFSTVHRCKGMEYDEIQLVKDFITEEKVERQIAENGAIHKINEEINLLYVAVTRARQKVNIPIDLVPIDFKASANVRILDPSKEDQHSTPAKNKQYAGNAQKATGNKKAGKFDESGSARLQNKETYKPWTPGDDAELTDLYHAGSTIFDLAKTLGRTAGAIRSRIKKLELS